MNNYKAIILNYQLGGTPMASVQVAFTNSSGVYDPVTLMFSVSDSMSMADVHTAAIAAVNTYASTNGYTVTGYQFLTDGPVASMVNAPQAAIANAPADAVTTYNVVTTLLGSLTGAVNTANTKQNDIATKLNSLLAELRTLGLIAA